MELCNAMRPASQIDWAPWIPTLVPGGLTAMRTRVIRAAVESLTSGARRRADVPLDMEEPAAVYCCNADESSGSSATPAATNAPEVPGVIAAIGALPAGTITPTPSPLAVDIATAAKMLGCGERYLKHEIDLGALRAFRIGRTWRVRVAELNAYMLRCEKGRQLDVALPGRGFHGRFAANERART
jgi:excisionase family DNA binding protein